MKCSKCNLETNDSNLRIKNNGDGSKSLVCKDCASSNKGLYFVIYWVLLFMLVLSSLILFQEYKKNKVDVIDVCAGQSEC